MSRHGNARRSVSSTAFDLDQHYRLPTAATDLPHPEASLLTRLRAHRALTPRSVQTLASNTTKRVAGSSRLRTPQRGHESPPLTPRRTTRTMAEVLKHIEPQHTDATGPGATDTGSSRVKSLQGARYDCCLRDNPYDQ
jgi:hypothetical protein